LYDEGGTGQTFEHPLKFSRLRSKGSLPYRGFDQRVSRGIKSATYSLDFRQSLTSRRPL